MTQVRVGEFRESEIIEVVGDSFSQCHFFDCEFTGTGVRFFDCVLVGCRFRATQIVFELCLFGSTDEDSSEGMKG